ncbi:MAG: GIY-YIG nuclease family protein [Tissierellia bacterium]|nr:GIY-YIG nuclease family protein [Tissierellia bacterium]
MCYVYILECADKTLYTGWTVDLDNRLKTHNAGKASKYTRSRLPVKLVYVENHNNKISAQKREWDIKQLSRKEKLKLLNSSCNEFE